MNKAGKIVVVLLLVVVVVLVGVIRHRQEEARSEPAPIIMAQAAAYAPGDYNGSIVTADGRTRSYILHIPAGFPAGKPYPLVLVFHGGLGTGARAEKGTNFSAKADAKGFIVVYPDGIGHNWNDGRGTANPTIDDVGFVRQLIGDLETRLTIDAKRIFATGVSNGGHFANRLGCELSDMLAAVGSDIGAMPANLLPRCKPARPIAMIGIQGAADPISPINGGEVASLAAMGLGKGGLVESATTTMNFWASVNGCDRKPTLVREPPRVNDGTSVDRYSFSGCKDDAPVVYYIVQGMGHAWPPHTQPLPQITGPTSHNINATDVMWDFFSSISR
jgi:polyhydroxybutyrate depolymerase